MLPKTTLHHPLDIYTDCLCSGTVD
jgi:hypothetical protein